jgi:ectoine hydroxylase-related dioxygenase (phytanoyl-CoA dioxygenase family)
MTHTKTASDVETHVNEVRTTGYTIVPDAVEPELIAGLRDTLRRLQETTPNLVQGTIHRSVGLLGEDPVFEVPPLHPSVFPIVEGVLGTGCLLTLYDALDVTPGVNKQPLHNDDALMPLQRPHQPFVCTTIWALTDFTEENGATRVVPGSHLRADLPDYAKHAGEYDTEFVEMSEGSVVVFDGALWHTSGENHTDEEWRLGLQVSYCAGFIRPLQNLLLSISPETARGYPDELLTLCGYATYNGIGQVIKHGAQDPTTKSPAAHVLGREPLPDAARVSHLDR